MVASNRYCCCLATFLASVLFVSSSQIQVNVAGTVEIE